MPTVPEAARCSRPPKRGTHEKSPSFEGLLLYEVLAADFARYHRNAYIAAAPMAALFQLIWGMVILLMP